MVKMSPVIGTATVGVYRPRQSGSIWHEAVRGTLYSGSNSIGDVAWYDSNSGGKTHPVGQKSANGFGLYDMSGNVNEWCWDWWKRDYSSGSVTDPRGPSSGSGRVSRGGWSFNARFARASLRLRLDPSLRDYGLSFRFFRKKKSSPLGLPWTKGFD